MRIYVWNRLNFSGSTPLPLYTSLFRFVGSVRLVASGSVRFDGSVRFVGFVRFIGSSVMFVGSVMFDGLVKILIRANTTFQDVKVAPGSCRCLLLALSSRSRHLLPASPLLFPIWSTSNIMRLDADNNMSWWKFTSLVKIYKFGENLRVWWKSTSLVKIYKDYIEQKNKSSQEIVEKCEPKVENVKTKKVSNKSSSSSHQISSQETKLLRKTAKVEFKQLKLLECNIDKRLNRI